MDLIIKSYFCFLFFIPTFNSYENGVVIYQCKLDGYSLNVDDWIELAKQKLVDVIDKRTSDIRLSMASDEEELISIETDSGVEITTISIETGQDETEGIVLTTNDNIEVTSIEIGVDRTDESECIEFSNENNTETYAKIGSIDGSSGLFVDNIYDLNGNILFQLDSSNNILIVQGKKFKMIPYIEEN